MNNVTTCERIQPRRRAAAMDGLFVSAAIVRAVLRAAKELGVDVDAILDEVGVEGSQLAPSDAYVAGEVEHHIWNRVLEQVDAARFGPAVARAVQRGDFREIEYVFRTSATLQDALASLARYNALLHGEPVFDLKPNENDDLVLRYLHPHGRGSNLGDGTEAFALTSVLRIARDAPRPSCAPSEVMRRDLDAPVAEGQAPAVGMGLLEAGLRHQPDHPVPLPTNAAQVRQTLESNLDAGDALTVTKCGARMNVSPRTLQDRLQREGVTFQGLLREIREERARRMLAGAMSVQQIAIALDYADTRAFRRAFKRWTSMTPSDYRRCLRGAPSAPLAAVVGD